MRLGTYAMCIQRVKSFMLYAAISSGIIRHIFQSLITVLVELFTTFQQGLVVKFIKALGLCTEANKYNKSNEIL